MNHANRAALRLQWPHGVPGVRSARARSQDKTAYSVMCAVLRTAKTICSRWASEISGTKNLTMGAIRRELVWDDFLSPEAEKMSAIQRRTGNQYLRKRCARDTRR